jgi:hypothetical protein
MNEFGKKFNIYNDVQGHYRTLALQKQVAPSL